MGPSPKTNGLESPPGVMAMPLGKNKSILELAQTDVKSSSSKILSQGSPGGAVVKNPPANGGDMGSSPGPVRSHMPWSN